MKANVFANMCESNCPFFHWSKGFWDRFIFAAMLSVLQERDKNSRTEPDHNLDAFMKALKLIVSIAKFDASGGLSCFKGSENWLSIEIWFESCSHAEPAAGEGEKESSQAWSWLGRFHEGASNRTQEWERQHWALLALAGFTGQTFCPSLLWKYTTMVCIRLTVEVVANHRSTTFTWVGVNIKLRLRLLRLQVRFYAFVMLCTLSSWHFLAHALRCVRHPVLPSWTADCLQYSVASSKLILKVTQIRRYLSSRQCIWSSVIELYLCLLGVQVRLFAFVMLVIQCIVLMKSISLSEWS